MDWRESLYAVIGPDEGNPILWWQMSIRGLVIFLIGLLLVRFFGRQAFGRQTPLGIVLSIIAGSNLSRALTGNSPFVATVAATIGLVIAYWIMNHLAARSPGFGWLVKGPALPLTREGRLDRGLMRRHATSEGDIEEAARRAGIACTEDVAEAVIERSGKISVIARQ